MYLNNVLLSPVELPFLRAICWQTEDIAHFTLDEMLSRYERGWVYNGVLADLEGEERAFVARLAKEKGSWLVTRLTPMPFPPIPQTP